MRRHTQYYERLSATTTSCFSLKSEKLSYSKPTFCFGLYLAKISSAFSSPPSVNSIIILLQLALDTFVWTTGGKNIIQATLQ